MNNPSSVKAYSLKVPKILGEKAIRLIVKEGLLHKELKVKPNDSYISVPLNQKPLPNQEDIFYKSLQQYDILLQDFSKHIKPKQNVIDIIENRLPPHLVASFPRAIDFIGNVAIVEIPPKMKEYKKLIGEAILEAHKKLRTVLVKASAISGVTRLREYEVIAGLYDTETIHKEHSCKYHLDPRKVYFSPRLSNEHSRVASQVRENEIVIDMFAGVGPFSILIARMRKNVKVYAIDVNPDAVRYLERNIIANGVSEKVIPIFGDAKEVIHNSLHKTADRVIMNLPEKAKKYISAASEAIKPSGGIMHYYEFMEQSDSYESIKERLADALKKTGRRVDHFLSVRTVREVAPFKWQITIDVKIR